jgi:hypothetical protein
LATRTGAAPRALGRGVGNGVRGEDRTRSYVNIEPTIREIKANTPVRRTPTWSGDCSIDGGDTWVDVMYNSCPPDGGK